MKKFQPILQIVGTIVKYAGIAMVVYDTIVFFKERLEKQIGDLDSTEKNK